MVRITKITTQLSLIVRAVTSMGVVNMILIREIIIIVINVFCVRFIVFIMIMINVVVIIIIYIFSKQPMIIIDRCNVLCLFR